MAKRWFGRMAREDVEEPVATWTVWQALISEHAVVEVVVGLARLAVGEARDGRQRAAAGVLGGRSPSGFRTGCRASAAAVDRRSGCHGVGKQNPDRIGEGVTSRRQR